jgi:sugar phosphate isomerase/epimerase
MTSPPDLICTYLTLAGNIGPFDRKAVSPVGLAERAEAAGTAGYRGLGFNLHDITHLLKTLGAAQVNAILDDNGLVHRELEVLLDWFVDGERRVASDLERRQLLQAAEGIGARHIKVGADLTGKTWPLDQLVEEFSRLCDQAVEAGTAITIELLPTSNLADLQTGRIIVEQAGRANGGLLLDIWHMVRGNIGMAAIASLPPGIVNHVELDDGPLLPRSDYLTDTIYRRVAPGAGEFPCGEFLDAIAATGYHGLYGVEILSDAYRTMPVAQAAKASYLAAAALFERAQPARTPASG